MNFHISENIKNVCPQLTLAIIECKVKNTETSEAFWQEMETEISKIAETYKIEDIAKRPGIEATRKAYKALGKDPNRYRPSAEALCRRIVRGIDIYKVNTLVDIINLVSMNSGFSIGGFDADKIEGNIELRIGIANDYFEAIGRGTLNVENLPLYCDEIGGIGTPTSDNERTKIGMDTTNLFVIVNGYNGEKGLKEAVDLTKKLLDKYAHASQFEYKVKQIKGPDG